MKKVGTLHSLKTAAQFILLLAILIYSFGTANSNRAYASSTTACGQQLAEAEAQFKSTLLPDGSVPASAEAKAAAENYIRVSKLCYDELSAQNSAGSLQAETPTYIDEGGMTLDNGASAEFALTGTKWGSSPQGTSGGTVTYSFMGNGISFSAEGYGNSTAVTSLPGFQTCFITDIQMAFAAWQAVANIHFVQVTDNGVAFNAAGAQGDIRIGAHAFDGASGTLAHAYFPAPNGTSAAGDMHFDSAENWTCNSSGIDIGIVALHEIGHSLGLNHENTSTVAVMDPFYNASMSSLQSDDISGVTAVYGAAQLSSPPPNDNFAGATLINSLTYSNTLDTTGATTAGTDPASISPCDGKTLDQGKYSVWYKYTPPVTQSIAVDTTNTNYDTVVAVWTGSEGSLSLVECDDDDFVGLTSSLSFIGTASTTYYFEVMQYNCEIAPNPCDTANPQTAGTLQFHVNITNTDVYVGASKQGSYYINNTNTVIDFYPGIQNGPLKATSSTGSNIFASQRAIYGSSFNELMGYPVNQFTTEYWFPWYDGQFMRTWVLVGNPSSSQTAYVDIYIAGVKRNNTPYTIGPGQRITPKYDGLIGGPVRVVSVTGTGTPSPINIFASERSLFGSSFNEVMGIPTNQFTTEYWFPWYDGVYMKTWILVGNPSSTQNAYVDIYIHGVKQGNTLTIPPNSNIQPKFDGIANGAVRVVSVTGTGTPSAINVFASERTIYNGGFSEVMGIPTNQFTTEYWFPWVDQFNTNNMRTWVLVGNPSSTQTAYVDIYIHGAKQSGSPFTISPNSNIQRTFTTTNGPVRVVSVNGTGTPSAINVFASERTLYLSSFNEMMGYPANQLTTEYWFPWYDDISMTTTILIGKP